MNPKDDSLQPFTVSIYFLPHDECEKKKKRTKIKIKNKKTETVLESGILKQLPLISCPPCSSSQASSRFQRSFIIAKEAVLSVMWVNKLTTSQVPTLELCDFNIYLIFSFLRVHLEKRDSYIWVPSTENVFPYWKLDVCQSCLFGMVSKTKPFCQRR